MEINKLQTLFGLKQFRDGQSVAIEAILNKKDTLVIMPTGGGKSLIYQFPAAIQETGVTIVVSPLIALMKDQVNYLNSLGITAMYCNSSQDELEQLKAISQAVTGKIKLLYVSPERVLSQYFLSMLQKMKVNFIAIDEAHCISQWGHDFRPEYRELGKIRDMANLKKIPFVALTATATEKVKKDIINSLNLQNPTFIQKSFFRKNLLFEVKFAETETEKETLLLDILKENYSKNGRVIIYCATRKKTEEVQKLLKQSGIMAGIYHAGKTDQIRENMQNSYATGKYKILVATNAFGMGVDHSDVRLVLHYQVPASVESYYQEAGRAGRDGKSAKCILLCRESDFNIQNFIISKESNRKGMQNLLAEMRAYTYEKVCRQIFLCRYFGEEVEPCGECDLCKEKDSHEIFGIIEKNQEKIKKFQDSLHKWNPEELDILKECIKSFPAVFGKKIIVSLLRGSRSKDILKRKLDKNQFYGKLLHISESSVSHQLEVWMNAGEIKISGKKYPKLYWKDSQPVKKKINLEQVTKKLSNNTPEKFLLRELKNFRDREARKLRWKKFMVFHNIVLQRIANEKPKNTSELVLIKGVGEAKIERFGNEILKIVSKY